MEYCAGGSMSDLYEATNTVLEEEELCAIVSYTVLGLHHLHSHRSIHRVCVMYLFLVLFYVRMSKLVIFC